MILKKGFTLSEVLVTLGIIGVVSAMTVPTLMQNYQRKTYVAQLHKFYNELSQASIRYMAERNALNLKEAGLKSDTAVDNFLKSNFKVIKTCTKQADCMAPSYKKMSGATSWSSSRKMYMVLASGASFGYGAVTNSNDIAISFDLDINGQQGPNVVGRDFFVISLYSNGLLDESVPHLAPATKEERENMYQSGCIANNANWTGCFGKILNDNWEMTY